MRRVGDTSAVGGYRGYSKSLTALSRGNGTRSRDHPDQHRALTSRIAWWLRCSDLAAMATRVGAPRPGAAPYIVKDS